MFQNIFTECGIKAENQSPKEIECKTKQNKIENVLLCLHEQQTCLKMWQPREISSFMILHFETIFFQFSIANSSGKGMPA